MDQYAQRITRDYPVRRKAQEKENMRTYLMGQLRALGYDAKLNDCGKAVNVIAGDPERASILYAAHYDTPLREPLPAILCPTRPVTYLLYQALHQAQRHEVTDVQAVRRRVKADVEGRLAVVDHFADLRLVRDLRDQAARLQLFINTHCIFSLSLFDLVSRRQFHETAAEKL